MTALTLKSTGDIRRERQRFPSPRCGSLVAAALWPKKGENLGTLVRTCDAIGACIAYPRDTHAKKALKRGNTIGDAKVCTHEAMNDPIDWLAGYKSAGWRLVAVELAEGATPLADLRPAGDYPTMLVIGHECLGVPQAALDLCGDAIEIPMRGVGNSLNVSVAASLVLYRLAGLS